MDLVWEEVLRCLTYTTRLIVVHIPRRRAKLGGGARVGLMRVAGDEAVWLNFFDMSKGDVKWEVGFIALEFRAGV